MEVQEVKADLLIKYNEYQQINCTKHEYDKLNIQKVN